MEGSGHIFGTFTHKGPSTEKCRLFLDKGECTDEIVLVFDDGQKLYVSENFLCYASPMFKAMFTHDCKEKETRKVSMIEKSLDDFQEFLLCLHPRKQKPIDYKNVMQVVALAEEYQVEGCVRKCQEVMIGWLTKEYESAVGSKDDLQIGTHAETCLKILTKAVAGSYTEVVTHAVETLARFRHKLFIDSENKPPLEAGQPPTMLPKTHSYTFLAPSKFVDPRERCKHLFASLPEEIKTKLALERLKLCDNDQML